MKNLILISFCLLFTACAPSNIETNRNTSNFQTGKVITTRGFMLGSIEGSLGKTLKAKLIYELERRGFTALDADVSSSDKADFELIGEIKADKKNLDLGTINGTPTSIVDGSIILKDVHLEVISRKDNQKARVYDLNLRSSSITLSDVARMFSERLKIDFKPVL